VLIDIPLLPPPLPAAAAIHVEVLGDDEGEKYHLTTFLEATEVPASTAAELR
jgi:hypothetical protein